MDLKEAIGAIVAGVALLIPAVKWLISDWAKKANELEVVKKQNTDKSLDRLEDDVKGFKACVAAINKSISELHAALTQNRGDVIVLKERFDDLKKAMDSYTKKFDSSLKDIIKSEMVELGKQAMLIREKKNGNG